MKAKLIVLSCLAALLTLPARSGAAPQELGDVDWIRDFDKALSQSEIEQKPALVLFQEVPGCSTCVNYGQGPLSHPLVVEAIETLFIPVVVFNNKGGKDREVLQSFREPSWNNPVVRIMTHDRNELASRVTGNYTTHGLVSAMTDALRKYGNEVPGYLRLLEQEVGAQSSRTEKGVFAMACFWSGEGKLGGLPGVTATLPGFLHGEEVVEVEFDPRIVSYEDLVRKAHALNCTRSVFTRDPVQQKIAESLVGKRAELSTSEIRPDREPKFYTAQTSLKYLPMTELQASRVNAAVGKRKKPEALLSPRQLELLIKIDQHPNAQWKKVTHTRDFAQTWKAAVRYASTL